MRFSVIIPTFQRRELVLACVQSLSRQTPAGGFEIIVVVDGSTDASAEALRRLRIDVPLTIIEQPNFGLSAARNAGAAIARGELLLFLDDDMEADVHLLAEHDREHAQRIALVLGHIPVHPESPVHFLSDAVGAWANERLDRLSRADVPPLSQDWVMGQSSLPRSLFFELGGFDDAFTREGAYGNEDLEFCYRVRQAGLPIVFNPRAVSRQRYVVSPQAHLRQWFDSGAADVRFVRKHPELVGQIFPLGSSSRWFAAIAYRPLRWVCLALIPAFGESKVVQRLFFSVRALSYARGVEAAGGVPQPGPVQILCYHAIADLSGNILQPYGVRPDRFRAQIIALQRRGHHFITVGEFIRFLNDGTGLPKRALLLTFDDCYQSLRDAALPILEELQVPAVAFAVSDRIGASNDWDAHLGAPALALADAAALKDLENSRIAIASHSCTHPDLRALSNEAVCREVNQSTGNLRSSGLEPVALFAYPYGEHDQRIRNAVQISGFDAAVTTEQGIAEVSTNRYRLPRAEVMAADSVWKLRFRLFRQRFFHSLAKRFERGPQVAASVTVVVPAFNAEDTLAATLASIRAQIFANWEAVIIDDGSTDATGQIADAWCRKDSRIRMIRRKNGGEAAARNTGIATALGDWLVFLDSDDWIAPEYLEQMVGKAAKDRLLDGVVCGCVRVTPGGVFTAEAVYGPLDLSDPFPKFVRNCPLAIHNCMIRRSVALEIGGFDETLATCADWDFWQRAARMGVRLGAIPDVLALYRIRPGSTSTNASRVLADGLTVIRRGYTKDPRVPKAWPPEFSDGLKADDLGETLFRHALWPASMQLASGQDAGVLLESLAGIRAPTLSPVLVGEELFHNIPLAAGEAIGVWPVRFSTLEQDIGDFLLQLELASGAAGLAEAALRHIERCILEAAEFESRLSIGASDGMRLEVTRPLDELHPLPGTRQFVLVVTERGKVVGSIAIPANTTSLKPKAIADAIAERLAWPLMRHHLGLQLAPASRLSFELHGLLQASNPVSLMRSLIGFSYLLLKDRKQHGLSRRRVMLKDLMSMLRELRPLSLAWRLCRIPADGRIALGKAALAEASRKRLPSQFSALAVRS